MRYSGLDSAVVQGLLGLLTYGSNEVQMPDPALQCLVRLHGATFAIQPHLVLGLALERNPATLLNRIPTYRSQYSALVKEKEGVMRTDVITEMDTDRFRYYSGRPLAWTRDARY